MRLKDLKTHDYHIYVDLDGVLADLQGAVEDILNIKITTSGGGKDWDDSDAIWEKLRELDEPDFSTLKKEHDADKLWNYVRPYHPNILTATGKPAERNAQQKREWVKKNITGYKDVFTVVASRSKAEFAWPDAVLIDDRMKSIGPWREKGGIGILHTSAEDSIRQLKKLGL
jgi:hypothetical protein